MKKLAALMLIIGGFLSHAANAECIAPKVIKAMADYDIIAGNTASIDMAKTFSGNDLTYSLKAKSHRANKSSINASSGLVHIDAEARDSFDVVITAKNSCGTATTKFNVQIDEEE